MKNKGELAPPESYRWTRADDYVSALARRRTARRKREGNQVRTQPETPRLLLSTVPFLGLIVALAILGVAIMITALGEISVGDLGEFPGMWVASAITTMIAVAVCAVVSSPIRADSWRHSQRSSSKSSGSRRSNMPR